MNVKPAYLYETTSKLHASYPSGGIANCCGAFFYGQKPFYYEQKGILVLPPDVEYTPGPREQLVEVQTSIGPLNLYLITESEYDSWDDDDYDEGSDDYDN